MTFQVENGKCYTVQGQAFVECVRRTHKGYWPVAFGYRIVFPGFQYGDDLRLTPFCWDLVLIEQLLNIVSRNL